MYLLLTFLNPTNDETLIIILYLIQRLLYIIAWNGGGTVQISYNFRIADEVFNIVL